MMVEERLNPKLNLVVVSFSAEEDGAASRPKHPNLI